MSELQSIRIDSLTGGWNSLDSKNSMSPNQAIKVRNFFPVSNGSIGPRLGSAVWQTGASANGYYVGSTLGFFQGTIANGGRNIVMYAHHSDAGVTRIMMKEYTTNAFRVNSWEVAAPVSLNQYTFFAQMQDRIYRTDPSNGVHVTSFAHQGLHAGAASFITTTDSLTAAAGGLTGMNAIWDNYWVENAASGTEYYHKLLSLQTNNDGGGNPALSAVTANGAAAGTITGTTNFTNFHAAGNRYDLIRDTFAGLPLTTAAAITAAGGLTPVFTTPGGAGNRMQCLQNAGASPANDRLQYLYILVPSDPTRGDGKPIRPEDGLNGRTISPTIGIWTLGGGALVTGVTGGTVTFPGADLERIARQSWLSPKPGDGCSIKIYRSTFDPAGANNLSPQDDEAWKRIEYYYVGQYMVGSVSNFVDTKNDTELVDLYTDTVLFSTVTEWRQHKFGYIAAHKNRMFYASESYTDTSGRGFIRGSRLYWSDLYHPDRVTGFVDVGPNDGSSITGIRSFNGALVIFKSDKVYLLTGSAPSSFDLRLAIPHLGLFVDKSIASMGNELVWLSQNGFVTFDGSTVREISQPIKPNVDSMLYVLSQGLSGRCSAMAEIDRYWFFFPFSSDAKGGYGFMYDTRYTDGTWWYFNPSTADTGAAPLEAPTNVAAGEGRTCIALNRATHGGQMLIGSEAVSGTGGTIYDWQNTAQTLDRATSGFSLEWLSPNMDAGAPELVKQWRHVAVDIEKVHSAGSLRIDWFVDSDFPDYTTSYTSYGSFTVDNSTIAQTLKFSLPQNAFGRRFMFRIYSSDHALGVPKINGVTIHYRLKRGARNREETR